MTVQSWAVYGALPGYAAEIVEIVGRRGEPVVLKVHNLDERDRLQFADVATSVNIAVGAGSGHLRQLLAREARSLGGESFPPVVDPTSVIASTALLGEGSTVNALAVIAAHTAVGRFVQINRTCSIGHDCVIDDYVTMGPGVIVASSARLGRGAFLGAGAVLRPGIRVGAGATIGAGAVVVADVLPGTVVVGNPARERVSARAELPLEEGW